MTDSKIIELARSLTDEQWDTLFAWNRLPDDHDPVKTHPASDVLLTYVRELADSLCEWEETVLAGRHEFWGAAVGVAAEALQGKGLLSRIYYKHTPLGRAVLRELERRRGK